MTKFRFTNEKCHWKHVEALTSTCFHFREKNSYTLAKNVSLKLKDVGYLHEEYYYSSDDEDDDSNVHIEDGEL